MFLRVPNFGFVVFDDERSVSRVLSSRPVKLPSDGHRLNVEEMKTKAKQTRPGNACLEAEKVQKSSY